MSYLDELGSELGAVGIRGRLRRRIVAEFRDHLECDPDAQLGLPAGVARRFADELGTARSRRAAWTAFGALALAGVLFGVAFISELAGFPHRHPHSALLGLAAVGLTALAAQVAFVAGSLGVIRAFRGRAALVLPRAAATILVRRAGIGLIAGLGAIIGLALMAVEYERTPPLLVLILAGVGAVALLLAGPAVLSAATVRPLGEGPGGDIFDDLGGLVPEPLRERPWTFAVLVAGALAAVVTFAGMAQHDPYDGAIRGIAEAAAFLGCFAVLGQYLGFRRPTT